MDSLSFDVLVPGSTGPCSVSSDTSIHYHGTQASDIVRGKRGPMKEVCPVPMIYIWPTYQPLAVVSGIWISYNKITAVD